MSSAHDLFCVDSPAQPGQGTWGSRFLSQEPRGPTATGCPLSPPLGLLPVPLPATRGSAGFHSIDCHQERGVTQLQMRKEHAP